MDADRFDALSRLLGKGATRRSVVAALAALAASRVGEAAAKRRPGKAKAKHKRHQNQPPHGNAAGDQQVHQSSVQSSKCSPNKACAKFCATIFGENSPAAEQCASEATRCSGLCGDPNSFCRTNGAPDPTMVCCNDVQGEVCASYTAAICKDLTSDPDNCGKCGNVCPAPGHATVTCSGGSCDFTCNNGFHRCDNACFADDDAQRCGTACVKCPDNQTCQNGTCACPQANPDFCSGTCTNTQSDVENCGRCDNGCPAPDHAHDPVCSNGKCDFTCDRGFVKCNGACVPACFVGTWGKPGTGDGEFDTPRGGGIAPDGTVYIADLNNNRIQYFTSNGDFRGTWGTPGSDEGQFNNPNDVAVAPDGTVYIADFNNHRIQYFDAQGAFLGKWGSQGSKAGEFSSPHGVEVSPANSIYIVDSNNHRVEYFLIP
jgi:hypothetical protein